MRAVRTVERVQGGRVRPLDEEEARTTYGGGEGPGDLPGGVPNPVDQLICWLTGTIDPDNPFPTTPSW